MTDAERARLDALAREIAELGRWPCDEQRARRLWAMAPQIAATLASLASRVPQSVHESDARLDALAREAAAECGDYVRRARDVYVDIVPMERIIRAALASRVPEPPQAQVSTRWVDGDLCATHRGMPLEGCPVCLLYEAHGYLARLFRQYAPQCTPLFNLMGVCSQIDNLLATSVSHPPALQPEKRTEDYYDPVPPSDSPLRSAYTLDMAMLRESRDQWKARAEELASAPAEPPHMIGENMAYGLDCDKTSSTVVSLPQVPAAPDVPDVRATRLDDATRSQATLRLAAALLQDGHASLAHDLRVIAEGPARVPEPPPNEEYSARLKAVAGALKSCIDAHGPITAEWTNSAAKRALNQMEALCAVAPCAQCDELREELDEARTDFTSFAEHHAATELSWEADKAKLRALAPEPPQAQETDRFADANRIAKACAGSYTDPQHRLIASEAAHHAVELSMGQMSQFSGWSEPNRPNKAQTTPVIGVGFAAPSTKAYGTSRDECQDSVNGPASGAPAAVDERSTDRATAESTGTLPAPSAPAGLREALEQAWWDGREYGMSDSGAGDERSHETVERLVAALAAPVPTSAPEEEIKRLRHLLTECPGPLSVDHRAPCMRPEFLRSWGKVAPTRAPEVKP